MRVRDIEIVKIDLEAGDGVSHIACGWVGCRAQEGASSIAKYKIKTGRTQAGLWQERIMPVCVTHEIEFRQKYMSNLCPVCKKNPVDDNTTRNAKNKKTGLHEFICDWCPREDF